jgi:putative endonuclease
MYYVYIIYNQKHDKFYIGQTYSLKKRIYEHKNGLSGYTSKYNGEWFFVYKEKYKTRSKAMKREKFLKAQKNKNFYKKLCRNEVS